MRYLRVATGGATRVARPDVNASGLAPDRPCDTPTAAAMPAWRRNLAPLDSLGPTRCASKRPTSGFTTMPTAVFSIRSGPTRSSPCMLRIAILK